VYWDFRTLIARVCKTCISVRSIKDAIVIMLCRRLHGMLSGVFISVYVRKMSKKESVSNGMSAINCPLFFVM